MTQTWILFRNGDYGIPNSVKFLFLDKEKKQKQNQHVNKSFRKYCLSVSEARI